MQTPIQICYLSVEVNIVYVQNVPKCLLYFIHGACPAFSNKTFTFVDDLEDLGIDLDCFISYRMKLYCLYDKLELMAQFRRPPSRYGFPVMSNVVAS